MIQSQPIAAYNEAIKGFEEACKRTNISIARIYDLMKTGKIVAEADLVAKRFEFNLIKAEVASESAVAAALNSMVNKIDALWIIPDGWDHQGRYLPPSIPD